MEGVSSDGWPENVVAGWLLDAAEYVKNSEWSEALQTTGVDVWEAALIPLYYALLRLLREAQASAATSRVPQRSHEDRSRTAVRLTASLTVPLFLRERRMPSRLRRVVHDLVGRGFSSMPENRDVVFLPSQVSHVPQQIPVQSALRDLEIDSEFVSGQGAVVRDIHRRGGRCTYVRLGAAGTPADYFRQIASARDDLLRDPGIRWPELSPYVDHLFMTQVIREKLQRALPQVLLTAEATRLLISRSNRRRVFVIGNDTTVPGRAAAIVCQEYGVPTVYIEHGAASGVPINGRRLATRVLVWGQAGRRQLIAYGARAEAIRVCGSPALDRIPRQTGTIHRQIGRKLRLDDGRPFVLLALSGHGQTVSYSQHLSAIRATIEASAALPGTQFVAKLHRRDRVQYYRQVAARSRGGRLQVVTYGQRGFPSGIFEWLQGCSCVITIGSSVAPEAMLMKVPVVSMNLDDTDRRMDFVKAGATLQVRSADELISALQSIHRNSAGVRSVHSRAARFSKDYFSELDGHAAKRCAVEIRELLRTENQAV